MRRLGVWSVLAAVALGGCGKSGGDGEPVATIGRHTITMEDIERRLAEMPPNIQAQFEGEVGRKNLLEGMLDEEAFLLAARDAKLGESSDVRRQIESAERRVLIQAYYQREVAPYTQMTDEDVIAYYEDHPDEFTRGEESEVRQIVLDTEAQALNIRRQLLAGAPWEPLIEKYCSDLPTRNHKGVIGAVAKNAALIPYVGSAPELGRMIDTLSVGKLSPPVKTARGYHIVTVERRNPPAIIPFDKVKDTIRRNQTASFAEKIRKEKVELLRQKYGVKILREPTPEDTTQAANPADRPAGKLFELAQATADPLQRIKYYDEIVRNHSEDPVACQAQFMIGFVYSEELHDLDKARAALERVTSGDLGCSDELLKNAKWLLDNMGAEPPSFQD